MSMGAEMQIGWTGKLPCRGDFVTGGARLQMFAWFDAWASEGMVAVRDGGGPAADAFLTSDLQRLAASRGVLGAAPVLAVVGPGMDRAARLYPFVLGTELTDDIAPKETLEANSAWFDEIEDVFLQALAPDFQPDRLAQLVASLPPPTLVPAEVQGRVLAHGILDSPPEAVGAPLSVTELFGTPTVSHQPVAPGGPLI